MKSIKTYIPSLILSVLLVFSLTGTSALIVARSFDSPDELIRLTEKNEIVPKVKTQLENYFSDKYNETGVPAEVYTEALTDGYIQMSVSNMIESGIYSMTPGTMYDFEAPENKQLEENITKFFSDYADSTGFEKNEVYNEKLSETIESAYKNIADYCDVYKFRTMNNEGILNKASGLYRNLDKITVSAAALSLLLIIVILLINLRSISSVLYWMGISALVSGIIGIAPCMYLTMTNYFDSFVIKQPHIFTAFTSLMTKVTDTFMMNQIILASAGILLIIIFAAVVHKKNKKA